MSQPAALNDYPTSWREEATRRLWLALSHGGEAITLRDEERSEPLAFEVVLRGEIDLADRSDLEALLHLFSTGGYDAAVVDLRAVTYFDSTGLSFLAQLARTASQRRGTVTLIAPSSPCLRVLKIVKMDEHFVVRA